MSQTDSNKKKIKVKLTGEDSHTAYVSLPGHTHSSGSVARTVSLDDVIANHTGPRVNLDFDSTGRLIGIEILASLGTAGESRKRPPTRRT